MIPNVQEFTPTIAANMTQRIDATGSFLLFVSSTGPFQFSIDGGPFQNGLTILGIDTSRDPLALVAANKTYGAVDYQFKSIILKDTSGSANTITIVVANSTVTYINPNATYFQKDAPTYQKCSGNVLLAAASWSAVFTGLDGAKVRKHFIVSNLDPANVLYTGDGANLGVLVPFGQSRILALSGPVQIYNPGGAGINYAVTEIFYA